MLLIVICCLCYCLGLGCCYGGTFVILVVALFCGLLLDCGVCLLIDVAADAVYYWVFDFVCCVALWFVCC